MSLQSHGETVAGISVEQLISSVPSIQSSTPLHFTAGDRHCWTYMQVNWSLLQVGGWGLVGPRWLNKNKERRFMIPHIDVACNAIWMNIWIFRRVSDLVANPRFSFFFLN